MVLILAGGGLGPAYETRILEKILREADLVYVETYTVPGSEWLVDFSREVAGDRVIVAPRIQLEDRIHEIIEAARSKKVVILVPGDPLIATTHKSVLVESAKRGVLFRVIPGVSGVCASMSLSLLDFYKFGRTITVPGPWRMVRAFSILDYIYSNACIGLHTLALLDISQEGVQLSPSKAAEIIMDLEENAETRLLGKMPVIVIERAGLEGERVTVYAELESLRYDNIHWREPASIVIPGHMSPIEIEHVKEVYGVEIVGIPEKEACNAWRRLREFLDYS